jgi:glutamine amidotransferase
VHRHEIRTWFVRSHGPVFGNGSISTARVSVMCELLGLCFDAPVAADITVHEFASRGRENPDGWGLAWYPDKSVALAKEAIAWQASRHTVFLESYPALRSTIYIGHVRHKTVGGPVTHADTHPFARELNGQEYSFAHNGTLSDLARAFPLRRFLPLGQTDSEHAFCHLLDAIATDLGDLQTEKSWCWLHAKLLSMNRHGRMNFLLSDGRSLFCYHDLAGHKGLTWRHLPGYTPQPSRLEDQDLKIELNAAPATRGMVVATCPLSGTGWKPVRPGELLVIQDGKLAFSQQSRQSVP